MKKITAWVAGGNDHPGCWLHGPAGSGKSTIAHTLAQLYDERKRLAFSFFFSRQDLDRRDATKFFLTFAYQLTVAIPLVEPAVRDALVKDHLTLYQSFKDQFTKLIVSPLQSIKDRIPCMVIIIDGLDECGNQGDVADIIQLLMNASPQLPFRLLFTSRPEAYIHTIFTGGGIAGNNYSITLHFLETMAARQAMHASQNILDTFPALPDPNRCSPFRTALKSLTKPTGIPGIQAGRPVSELTALQSCNISSSVSHNTLSHVADFSLAASSMILQFLVRAAYNSSAPCFQEAAGLALGIVECVQVRGSVLIPCAIRN